MSKATSNFFGVLGEDAGSVQLKDEPKVAANTSSRKSDSNPRADPSKARKRPAGAPSNDKLLKDSKDAGRSNNRRVPVAEGQPQHHSRRHDRTDRQPRSAHRDTARRERSGWGDETTDAYDQEAGREIAAEDKAHDAAEDAEIDAAVVRERQLTLEEFQAQRREQQQGLNTRGAPKPAAAATPAPAQAASHVPEKRKKNTTKGPKTATTFVFDDSSAAPEERKPRAERRPQGDRPRGERRERPQGARGSGSRGSGPRGARGSGPKPKGDRPAGKRGEKSAAPAKPRINLSELPTLGSN